MIRKHIVNTKSIIKNNYVYYTHKNLLNIVQVGLRDLLFFLCCIPLVIARGLAQIDNFFLADLPRIIAVGMVLIYIFIYFKSLSILVRAMMFYSVYIIVATLIKTPTNPNMRDILLLATNFALCIIIDLYFNAFMQSSKIIKYLFIINLISGIINLTFGRTLTQERLFYSQNIWLLGQRNEIYLIYFNLLLYMVLLFLQKKRLRLKPQHLKSNRKCNQAMLLVQLLFLGNLLFFRYLKIGGAFSASLAMFIALPLSKFWIKRLNLMFFLIILFNFLVVFFRIQDIFSYFIVEILHRDLTFTGRVYTWDRYIQIFLEYPIFGCGFIQSLFVPELNGFWHPHNFLLKVLTTGGIILLLCFCFILFQTGRAIEKAKKTTEIRTVAVLIVGYLTIGISTSLESGYQLFPVLVIAWNMSTQKYKGAIS